MEKTVFRKRQKQKLAAFALQPEKIKEDQLLLDRFLNTDLFRNSQTIGVTSSLPQEVDTSHLIARLWDAGKKVYLAKANADSAHTQEFLRYTYRSQLKKSAFGVEEIVDSQAEVNNQLDLIIVPGLAFALDSHQRLGFGGGYYDRFLAKHPTKTVALVNSKMLFGHAQWPVEATDIPVKVLVTTTGVRNG